MAGQACPGPCNTRAREAQAAHTRALALYDPLDPEQSRPEPPGLLPVDGQPVWCGPCTSTIRSQLAELDDLESLLAAAADGYGTSTGDARVGGTHPEVSPSRAGDDLDEVLSVLAGWEHAYRDLIRAPSPPRRGHLATVRTCVIAWLGEHLDAILASGLAADFGREVMELHREHKAKAKAGTRKFRKPLRCRCGLLSLEWDEEKPDTLQCLNPDCHLVMTYGEYEAQVERAAGMARRGELPAAV